MQVEVQWVGGRRLLVRARDQELAVDVPPDQGGEGGFRPVELLLASLGGCMAGTMLGFARNQGIAVRDVRVRLEDEILERPERIARVAIEMQVDGEFTERQRASLERAASHCKIHNTLGLAPEIALTFQCNSTSEREVASA